MSRFVTGHRGVAELNAKSAPLTGSVLPGQRQEPRAWSAKSEESTYRIHPCISRTLNFVFVFWCQVVVKQ